MVFMALVNNNNYTQLRDYLTQVRAFSCKDGLPCITQKLVAEKLGVGRTSI